MAVRTWSRAFRHLLPAVVLEARDVGAELRRQLIRVRPAPRDLAELAVEELGQAGVTCG